MNLTVVAPPALPATIRDQADHEAARIARFVARHPQYNRLPPDVLLQYADTYRDDADHALEQEFRDNGVLCGCRADYHRRSAYEGIE